jgi:Protein of unknown function (DUF1360)
MPDINALLNPVALIVLALAVFRITRLITTDHIFDNPRNRLFDRFPPDRSWFGYLFTCNWCMSIWVASLVTVSYTIIPTVTIAFSLIPALSAVAAIIAARFDD